MDQRTTVRERETGWRETGLNAETPFSTGSRFTDMSPSQWDQGISLSEAVVNCDAFWKAVDAEISIHKYHCQKESGLFRLPGSQRFTKTAKFRFQL